MKTIRFISMAVLTVTLLSGFTSIAMTHEIDTPLYKGDSAIDGKEKRVTATEQHASKAYISFKFDRVELNKAFFFTIMDENGQVIENQLIDSFNESIKVDVSNYTTGGYQYKIQEVRGHFSQTGAFNIAR